MLFINYVNATIEGNYVGFLAKGDYTKRTSDTLAHVNTWKVGNSKYL